jgi:small subunit ribosomal protein S11
MNLDYVVHIYASLNNTILSLADSNGSVIFWSSSGTAGFRNAKKSTSYSAQQAGELIAQYCIKNEISKLRIKIRGSGSFACKESSIKGLQLNGIQIMMIEDRTSIAHNGCRLPKKRRL